MADIAVRVPKGEVDHFWDEPPHKEGIEWWTLSNRPKNFKPGEHLYFVIDGQAVARATVRIIDDGTYLCEMTGRDWTGHHLVWDISDFEQLDKPFDCTVGRGFTYLE